MGRRKVFIIVAVLLVAVSLIVTGVVLMKREESAPTEMEIEYNEEMPGTTVIPFVYDPENPGYKVE